MFITLEGVEGSGKTTVAKELSKMLIASGQDVICTREPGGNKISEAIRDVVLDKNNVGMDIRTEALLYAAARSQHVADVIKPALEAKKIVICDRFIDSSIAYQGFARGIGDKLVEEVNDFAIAGIRPDLTFLIDILPEIGLERINKDKNLEMDRLDLEELSFHQAVYEGYQLISEKEANRKRMRVVDGNRQAAEIIAEIFEIIQAELANNA